MAQDLFRKESMERIASPDELHHYIRATSPRLWMVLIIVIALLGGFIFFAAVSVMENTLDVKAEVDTVEIEGEPAVDIILLVPPERADSVKTGMKVRIANTTASIDLVFEIQGQTQYHATPDDGTLAIPSGTYDAQIILEAVSPLSFLLGRQ